MNYIQVAALPRAKEAAFFLNFLCRVNTATLNVLHANKAYRCLPISEGPGDEGTNLNMVSSLVTIECTFVFYAFPVLRLPC